MFRACNSLRILRLTTVIGAAAATFLSLAACSSGNDTSNDESSIIGGGEGSEICSFPTRTYSRALADHYILWSTDAEREAYLPDFLASNGLVRSTDPAPLVSLQRIVDELYPAIRAELPAELEGIDTPPRVVLLASPLTNAFAAGDNRSGTTRAPWLLFVNDGLLALNAPDAEVKGVMAHELAHLMAKHQFPDTPTRVRRYYAVGERDEKTITSALEKDDAQVRAYADKVEAFMAYAGAFDNPELKGFSVKFSGLTKPIRYHVFFELLARAGTPECEAHGTKYAAFQDSLRENLSKFDHTFKLGTPAAKAKVSAAAQEAEAAAHACVASVASAGGAISLTDLASTFELQVHPERASELQAAQEQGGDALRRAVLDADEIAVDDDAASGTTDDVVTKLLKLGKTKHAQMAALATTSKLKVDSLRRYAEEAEADQIAVRVLRHAGVDATGGAGFLLRTMDPASKQQCEAVLARGEVPPFGGFTFLHPATCWRVFQAKLFATQLSTSCRANK